MDGQFLSKQASKQARISYIDLFRAIGIILMIMGHIGFGKMFDHWIHAFHMPMFFFASGYFFKPCISNHDFHVRIKSRCKTLLLPYVVFSVIRWCINYYTGAYDYSFFRVFIFNTSGGAGAVWFLTALFIADIIYSFLDWKLSYGLKLHAMIIGLAISGNLFPLILSCRPPLGIDSALVGIGFIHLARVIRIEERINWLYELRVFVSCAMVIISSILIFINGYVNLRLGKYGIIPLFWINSILTIIGGWNLCRITGSNVKFSTDRIYNYLTTIGQDSIIYLCLNQLVIYAVYEFLSILNASSLISKILMFFIVMLLLDIFRRVFLGSELRIFIGKWLL